NTDSQGHTLYTIQNSSSLVTMEEQPGPPVPIEAIEVSLNANRRWALTDGDLTTRWETGPQKGNETVVIDLGREQRVDAVVLSLGQFTQDYPRELAIETMNDAGWNTVWHGQGVAPAMVAAIRDPKRRASIFAFPAQTTRWLRLRQLGQHRILYWSV